MARTRRPYNKLIPALLLGLVAIAGLAVLASHVIDSRLPQYRQMLAADISERLDRPVSIKQLDLHWQWTGPELRMTGFSIGTGSDPPGALHIAQLGLQFAFTDLLRGRRLPRGVVVHEPDFVVDGEQFDWTDLIPGKPLIDWSLVAQLRDVLDYVAIEDARITFAPADDSAPLRIGSFQAAVHKRDDALKLTLNASADGWLDGLTVTGRITGALPDFKHARLTLTTDALEPLALWHKLAADMPALTGGTTRLQAQAEWQTQELQTASLQLRSAAVQESATETDVVPALTAGFKAHTDAAEPGIIQVQLDSLSGDAAALADMQASLQLDTNQSALHLKARDIAAELLAPALQTYFEPLAEADIDGTISHAELAVGEETPLRATATFDALRARADAFAIGSLSGTYSYGDGRNRVHFTGADGSMRLAHYMHGTLPLSDLSGELGLRATEDGLQVRFDSLQLTSEASAMTLSGSLILPRQGMPIADLRTHLTTPDCSVLLAHVPRARDLPFDDLRPWLATAILSGDVEVEGYLTGPVDRLFDDDGEHLGITVTGSDFAMDYQPGWPQLTNASGTIRLRGAALDISIDQAKMLGVEVGPVALDVADVRDPVLMLDGRVRGGSAQRMLSFLQESPLRDDFGMLVEALDLSGTAGLDLKLRLPLNKGLGDTKVSGTIHANDNALDHAALPAPIRNLSGAIHFDQDGLHGKDIRGQLLHADLRADIAPGSDGSSHITSRARISLPENSDLLSHYLPAHWLQQARGSAAATLELDIDHRGRLSDLTLHSALEGMALDLPEPLHKPADTGLSLQLHLRNDGALELTLGEVVHADLTVQDGAVQRGVIVLGGGSAPVDAPAGPGIWLGGHIADLRPARWLDLLQSDRDDSEDMDTATASSGPGLLGADLAIDTLHAGSYRIDDIQLRIDPLSQAPGWRVTVDGPNTHGNGRWQPANDNRGALQAHLGQVYADREPAAQAPTAPDDAQHDTVISDADPRSLPALDVTIDQLYLNAVDFGTVNIKASTMARGWHLERLALDGGALTLHASGDWSRHVGLTEARLDADIEAHGLARLLQAMGRNPPIRAQHAAGQATLQITANDYGLDLASMDGQLSVQITDGTLESLEPGVGRLLGLLNLHVLPRRLLLDFSDVVDSGMAFDVISGDFDINNGNAFTENFEITTPEVMIGIIGRIGLAARDYDQTIHVTPELSGSLTLAGAILGGPAVGAGLFALQELLGVPLAELPGTTYKLTGSWDDPRLVEQAGEE